MAGQTLGGSPGGARRIGRVVHRRPTPDFAATLLRYLRSVGWPYAPTLIARSLDGTVLSYVNGTAALTEQMRHEVAEDYALRDIAMLVRRFHDLMAGTPLAGDAETVCHNDLDPRNTVYRRVAGRLRPIALVDWDMAAPGPRSRDLGHLCWTYTGLGPTADPGLIRRRIGVLLDAYGWQGSFDQIVEAMVACQDRSATAIVEGAAAGDPGLAGLLEAGAAEAIRADQAWVRRHLCA